MPDLINNGGNVVDIATNYRKMTPQTTYGGEYYSNFGTRQIAWFKVALANISNGGNPADYTLSNSLFSQAVRGLQLNTEVYFISKPVNTSTDYFVVAVANDTTGDNSKEDEAQVTQRELVKAIVDKATGLSSTVTDYTF